MPRYADWKAPDDDGQIVIWPDPSELLRQIEQNHRALSRCEARVGGLPLSALRKLQREGIGVAPEQPLVATGHQTELYHPGVWVKDVLIGGLARRTGGQARHFAVDTDSPKHLHLRWPGTSGGEAERAWRGGSMPISDDPRLAYAPWAQLIAAPGEDHLRELRQTFDEASAPWGFVPMVDSFLDEMGRAKKVRPSLPAALTSATLELNQRLGVSVRRMPASDLWGSAGFLLFAHHFLARAEAFAMQYNAALRDYRREEQIHAPGRPMPDLAIEPDQIEMPFWLDDLGRASRRRLALRRGRGGWMLEDFCFNPETHPGDPLSASSRLSAWLRARNWRISPRALMLTMYLRLTLADDFVHGIGGGRYDRVTDRIISTHFGIEPPRFSVTTATLYFPAAHGEKRINLRPLLQEGRRLRHGSFWAPKRELAARIAELPRRSARRRELFHEMHGLLAKQAQSPRMQAWAAQLEEAGRAQARQKPLFDRELFYAIQSEGRLRDVISRYDAAVREA